MPHKMATADCALSTFTFPIHYVILSLQITVVSSSSRNCKYSLCSIFYLGIRGDTDLFVIVYTRRSIGLYRDVWVAAIAWSRTSLETQTVVVCTTSQCKLRSLRANSGMWNVERNFHCDVVHITTVWVSSLTLDCNDVFAIKAYMHRRWSCLCKIMPFLFNNVYPVLPKKITRKSTTMLFYVTIFWCDV